MKRRPVLMFLLLAFPLSWYPWIISLIRHAPSSGPNPLGVMIAALIVTAITQGRTGVKDFFARIIRVRAGFQWYAFVLLLPLVLCAVASALTVLLGAHMSIAGISAKWPELIDRFI